MTWSPRRPAGCGTPTQPIRRTAPAWAASVTLEEVGLRQGRDDSYRGRAIQLVLCDWMRRELAGKILWDEELRSEMLEELSSAYWMEPWRLD